jgi:hypothetical protein
MCIGTYNARLTYLDDTLRDLRRRHDGVRAHHPVGVLLPDLVNQKSARTSSSTTTERVRDLEAYVKYHRSAAI